MRRRVREQGMSEDIEQRAAEWHAAQAGEDMDWDGFTAWLEADPRHRAAYDEVALLDARIDRSRDLLRSLTAPAAEVAPRSSRRWLGWGSAAAAAVAAAAVFTWQTPAPDAGPRYADHRAPAGEGRAVQLADGSSIALDPGSLIRVSTARSDPILLQGRAVFTIRHNAANPTIVRAGPYEVRDIGTVFEVSSTGDAVRVAVSEGKVAVALAGGGRETTVAAGQSLTASAAAAEWQIGTVRPAAVAAWRRGPLVYDGAPLALVAGDIARFTGAPLTVDRDVAARRFSGVIAVGSRDAMAGSLAQLTGLTLRKEGDAARLASGARR
ncbi:FecR domain-containing protein [Roseomonas aeriglobus]|nr:FecR domain-containing protein [Roseomonas aeriglobus]